MEGVRIMHVNHEWPDERARQAAKEETRTLIRQFRQCSLERFTMDDLDSIRDIERRIDNGRMTLGEGVVEISATFSDRQFLSGLLSKASTN